MEYTLKPHEERFIEEYQQLEDRIEKLGTILENYYELDFAPECPFNILNTQHFAMRLYLGALKQRPDAQRLLNLGLLSIKKPNAQEKLNADALLEVSDYWGCRNGEEGDCPVKVDGQSPSERYGVVSCADAMILDLLRRQREIDAEKAENNNL